MPCGWAETQEGNRTGACGPHGGLKGHRKVTNQVSRPQMTTELPCGSWLHPQRRQRGLGFGPAPLHPRSVAPAVHPHMPASYPGNTFTMAFPSSSPVPPYKPVQCDLAPPATKPMPPRECAPARRTRRRWPIPCPATDTISVVTRRDNIDIKAFFIKTSAHVRTVSANQRERCARPSANLPEVGAGDF